MDDQDVIKVAAKMLNLSDEKMEADLVDLIWRYESILEAAHTLTAKGAFVILLNIVIAYLRGKGLRMGNYTGFQKHSLTLTVVTTAVFKQVEMRGKHWYPEIHKVGLGSLEAACLSMGKPDILEIADHILRSSQ